jgi:tryptophan-rich sensory protein
MFGIFWVLFAALCGYLAYRIIRGGLARPQSKKLNVFGIFACVLLLMLAYSYVSRLFQ